MSDRYATAKHLLEVAVDHGDRITAQVLGVEMVAEPGMTVMQIYTTWYMQVQSGLTERLYVNAARHIGTDWTSWDGLGDLQELLDRMVQDALELGISHANARPGKILGAEPSLLEIKTLLNQLIDMTQRKQGCARGASSPTAGFPGDDA